jgi:hypothetical protein
MIGAAGLRSDCKTTIVDDDFGSGADAGQDARSGNMLIVLLESVLLTPRRFALRFLTMIRSVLAVYLPRDRAQSSMYRVRFCDNEQHVRA